VGGKLANFHQKALLKLTAGGFRLKITSSAKAPPFHSAFLSTQQRAGGILRGMTRKIDDTFIQLTKVARIDDIGSQLCNPP
jgi:hypothetical protein